MNGGGAYSTFQSTIPAGPRITTVNLPAGVDYSTRHFGTGFQYQRTVNIEGGGGGNDYAVNARASAGQFQLSGFYRHDVQVPTLAGAVSLKVPPGTHSGQQLRLARRGLPKPHAGEGDLFAIVQIAVPGAASERERKLYQELAEVSTFNPRGHFAPEAAK